MNFEQVNAQFATGFVLVRHRLQIPVAFTQSPAVSNGTSSPPPSCLFFSLYMHLLHWQAFEEDRSIERPGFLGIDSKQGLVDSKGSDPAPEGTEWKDYPCPPPDAKGLNVRDQNISLNQRNSPNNPPKVSLIGWLPRGTHVKLGAFIDPDKKWRKLEGIEGKAYWRDDLKQDDLLQNGMVEVEKLDLVIGDPKVKDAVFILPEPVDIKAGALVGYLGNYLRFNPEVHQKTTKRSMVHVEVIAGPELKEFIEQCRELEANAPDNLKHLLVVEKGARPVETCAATAALRTGEGFMLDPDSPKEGAFVKLLRGKFETVEKSKLPKLDEARQRYGDKYFYQALRPNVAKPDPAKPGDFTDPKSSVEFFTKNKKFLQHTWIKTFTPGQETVWVLRYLVELRKRKNANGIFEIENNIVIAGWEHFPLKAGENEITPMLATQVFDLKKKDNPFIEKQALDDEKRIWRQVRYPALSQKGSPELKTGWVCEKDFEKVCKCSPWAWPGFEMSEMDPLEPADLFKRRLTGDYSPNTPLLKLLFDLLDEDGNKQLSPTELRRGWEKPWLAQTLSRQIIEHKSEWGLEKSKWEALDEHMKQSSESIPTSAIRFLDIWQEEKKRIEKLQFWKEVKGQHGFPEDIKVWHVHPLGLVENFAGIKSHPVIINNGVEVELEFLEFNDGVPISEDEYTNAAAQIGCEVAIIKAFAQVESGKLGPFFNFNGWDRVPTILFERHQFHKYSKGVYSTEANRNISNSDEAKRTNAPYPDADGYWASEYQYQRLLRAYALDKNAALMSASWGRFQMMGFNYNMIPGVKSVEDMVRKYSESEKWHFRGLVGYVNSTPILRKALKEKNWATAALSYNGQSALLPRNAYDKKLEAAYNALK
jgi:hypothetical protein